MIISKNTPTSAFLTQLQREASLQSQLYQHRLLPPQLDRFTAIIGRYPWQSVLIVSGCIALGVEVVRYWIFW